MTVQGVIMQDSPCFGYFHHMLFPKHTKMKDASFNVQLNIQKVDSDFISAHCGFPKPYKHSFA